MAKSTCNFKTTEASTKAWFRTNDLIDDYLNINPIKNNEFRKQNTRLSKKANQLFGVEGRLFLENSEGSKAFPNKEMFYKIDAVKGIFYPENYYLKGSSLIKPLSEEQIKVVKPGVPELFDSNPQLANAVYETLGFKEKLSSITPKVSITNYRTMDDKSKKDAIDGVEEAQKRWVEEEIAEFYEAINQYNKNLDTFSSKGVNKGKATIDDVIDETLGIFRTIQMFPKFSDLILPYIDDIQIAIDSFGRKEGYTIYKAKKDKKGQAKEMTYENLFEVVDKYMKPFQITPQQKQQALQLYSQYLDTIFPDSKVKDIVYHGTNAEKFEKFIKQKAKTPNVINDEYVYIDKDVFYFTKEFTSLTAPKSFKNKLNVLLNIENLETFKNRRGELKSKLFIELAKKENEIDRLYNTEGFSVRNNPELLKKFEEKISKLKQELKSFKKDNPILEGKDPLNKYIAAVLDKEAVEAFKKEYPNATGIKFEPSNNNDEWYVVFEPEQIHILGSKQDIEGFKKFVGKGTQPKGQQRLDFDHPSDDVEDDTTLSAAKWIDMGATKEQLKGVETWWQSSPLRVNIPLEQLANIVNSDAWATWSQAGIRLRNTIQDVALYHESWHAFSQLYLTKAEKRALYDSVKKAKIKLQIGVDINGKPVYVNSDVATDKQVEEYLAEEFRAYATAMGAKKEAPKSIPAQRRNIFKRIWDFLMSWFPGATTAVEDATSQGYIQPVQEVFDTLYFAGSSKEAYDKFLNRYKPSIENIMFEELKMAPVSLNEETSLNIEDAYFARKMAESFIGSYINEQVSAGKSPLSALVFIESNKKKDLYNYVKRKFEEVYKDITDRYDALSKKDRETNEGKRLAQDISSIKWILDNYGNTEDVLNGREDKGYLHYFLNTSDVLKGIKIIEDVDLSSTNAEDIAKSYRMNDKSGQELSVRDLATIATIRLIKTLYAPDAKEKDGIKKNRLGVPELVDFNQVWNQLVRNLAGYNEPEDLWNIINDPSKQEAIPIYKQLAFRLNDPNYWKDTGGVSQLDLWTDFWQDFNKPRIPLVVMINQIARGTEESEDDLYFGKKEEEKETEYTYVMGKASSDTRKVRTDWRNKFFSQTPESNAYVEVDSSNNPYLNLNKIIKNFITYKGTQPILKDVNRALQFYNAIGIYIDNNSEIKSLIDPSVTTYFAEFIDELDKRGIVVSDPISVFSQGLSSKIKSLNFRINELAEIQYNYSDTYSNLSVSTASNDKAYEHSLNFPVSIIVESINKAQWFQELYDPNGSTPYLQFLDPRLNPDVKAISILNDIFILDVDLLNPDFGKRRKGSKLILENINGTQLTENNIFQNGVSMSKSDRHTKFITDFHMLLNSGYIQNPKAGSKSGVFGVRPSKKIKREGVESHLYIDTGSLKPRIDKQSPILKNGELFDHVFRFIEAEIRRINIVKNNPKVYKNINVYSKENNKFFAFDNVLEPSTKEALLDKELYEALLEDPSRNALKKILNEKYPDLADLIKTEVTSYFEKIIDQTANELSKADFVYEQLYRNVIGAYKTSEEAIDIELNENKDKWKKAMIASYTINSWIHNLNMYALLHGGLQQFNHKKDEGNKRTSNSQSPGNLFRTDAAFQDYINNNFKRPLALKMAKEGKVSEIVANRKYNGTLATSIIKEVISKSAAYEFYAKKMEDFYRERIKDKNPKLSKKKIDELVNDILYGKGGNINDPQDDGEVAPYFAMKEADGQGYVALDTYRILQKARNKWTKEHESIFQSILEGYNPTSEEVLKFFSPVKYSHYGMLVGEHLPALAIHKFSLAPMIPGLMDENITKLHDKMIEEGIDYVTFESGSKAANITDDGSYPSLYKGELDERNFNSDITFLKNVNTIWVRNLRDQVDINVEWKTKSIFSTQFRTLLTSGLFLNGIPSDFNPKASYADRKNGWNKLTEKQKLKYSNYKKAKAFEIVVEQITEQKKAELLIKGGLDPKADLSVEKNRELLIENVIKPKLKNLGIPEHQFDYFDVNPITGEIETDISAIPWAGKFERIFLSLVNNELVKQKIKGEPLVLVANTLFEKPRFRKPTEEEIQKYGFKTTDLATYGQTKRVNPVTGKSELVNTAMKIKISLQGDFENLFNVTDKEGKEIRVYKIVEDETGKKTRELDFDKTLDKLNTLIKDEEWLDMNNNRKLITMVGVRIPVQGDNSMEFMEVYEFLPPKFGNILIPPQEIVAKAGADFDIDKLTVYLPSISKKGKYLDLKYENKEDLQKDIDKAKEEREALLKSLTTEEISIAEYKKKIRNNIQLTNDELKYIIFKLEEAKAKKTELIQDISFDLIFNLDSKYLTEDMKEVILSGSEKQIFDLFISLNKSKLLGKISKDRRLLGLKTESFNNYTELKSIYDSLNITLENRDALRSTLDKINAANEKVAELMYIKKNFIGQYENKLISSITDILSSPEKFASLIRPNNNNIGKRISEEIKPFVQENNWQKSLLKDGGALKKGVSPTRLLEPVFNLDKHFNFNTGKNSLGIAAIANKYHSLFMRYGALMPESLTFLYPVLDEKGKPIWENGKMLLEPEDVPIKYYLDHNFVIDENGKHRISLSDIYDNKGIQPIADIISQIMNGAVDLEKDEWLIYIQGYVEVIPTILSMVEAGITLDDAGWFTANPFVLEYVKQQRLIKTPYAEQLETSIDNPMYFRAEAFRRTLRRFGYDPEIYSEKNIYKILDKELGNRSFTTDELKTIAATKSKDGLFSKFNNALLAFLHFYQIEKFNNGIKQLRLKTNVDTKKDTSLFLASNRDFEIESLPLNEKIDPELARIIINDSILSTFRIQKFQGDLWSPLLSLESNKTISSFLIKKMQDVESFNAVKEQTGYTDEKIMSAFISDLKLALFQNYVKAFNINMQAYKSLPMTTEIPVKIVDRLTAGVLVAEKVPGKPVIYIDKSIIENDFKTQAYLRSEGANNYASRGLAVLDKNVFLNFGEQSAKEYQQFVIEREYLRYGNSISSLQNDPLFESIKKRMQEANSRNKEEDIKSYEERINKLTYEEFLKVQALVNIGNMQTLYYDKNYSLPKQIMDIINSKDNQTLLENYPVLKYMAADKLMGSSLTNLYFKLRDIEPEIATSYFNQLKDLANPDISKIDNGGKIDQRISYLFKVFPVYAYMQNGMTSGKYDFSDILPFQDIKNILVEPIGRLQNALKPKVFKRGKTEEERIEINKEIDAYLKTIGTPNIVVTEDTVSIADASFLEAVWNRFSEVNSRYSVATRTRKKNYLFEANFKEVIADYKGSSSYSKNFLVSTANPNVFKIADRAEVIEVDPKTGKRFKKMVLLDAKRLQEIAKANPDKIFVFDDIYSLRVAKAKKEFKNINDIKLKAAFKNPMNRIAIYLSGLNNAMGIITMRDQNAATNPQNSDQFDVVTKIIDKDIQAIYDQYNSGKKLVFVGPIGSMLNITPTTVAITPTVVQPQASVSTTRKTYSGKVTSLQPNQIFVFGSNPEGRHGAGAAKNAKDLFGAKYGQGRGMQGQSYALVTKNLKAGFVEPSTGIKYEKEGEKSVSKEQITNNIKELYLVATQNPTKEFLIPDYSKSNLNGYTGQEMADMFNAAGPIPSNIVFNENFDKLLPSTQPQATVSNEFQGYKGGFEDKGKGTPEGDGKDKAMREVATASIVEMKSDKKASSSMTTLETVGTDNDYSYEKDRYVGSSYNGSLPAFSGMGIMNNFGTTVMLARNSELKNLPLSDEAKRLINVANQQGAAFVVGDMPGVDSQFIDYLQKIGAKFTIYHTGTTPRINIVPTQATISIAKVETARSIYDKINKDKKTKSANVEIAGQGDLSDVKYDAKTFWSEVVPEARMQFGDQIIIAYRGKRTNTFLQNYKGRLSGEPALTIGNPFDWQVETGTRDEQGIKSTKRFIHWMITGDNMGVKEATPEYRQAIIDDIKNGKLKNRPIIYYQEKGYATHATALDYLINKYDWSEPAQVPVSTPVVSEGSNSLQKSIFDHISKELYNKFKFVNPGSENIPSIKDILTKYQDVTEEDWLELKRRCYQ